MFFMNEMKKQLEFVEILSSTISQWLLWGISAFPYKIDPAHCLLVET